MTTKTFRVRVTKDHLVFSAAHFITFNSDICENIHGHNWRLAAEIEGPLDTNSYVFDFIALRDNLQKIVNELDHHILLPTKHTEINVKETDIEVVVRFREKRWLFPLEDCVLLPVDNTTAERIAEWIGEQFINTLEPEIKKEIRKLRIDVEENFGQWAQCEFEFPPPRRTLI